MSGFAAKINNFKFFFGGKFSFKLRYGRSNKPASFYKQTLGVFVGIIFLNRRIKPSDKGSGEFFK